MAARSQLAAATIELYWNAHWKKWHVRGEMIEGTGARRVWTAEAHTTSNMDSVVLHELVAAVRERLESFLV